VLIASKADQVLINERYDNQLVIPIYSLARHPYRLRHPIHLLIEGREDIGYGAYSPELNVGSGGETINEAIEGFKDFLVGYFERVATMPDSTLGPGPLTEKYIMADYIEPAV
jgi:hypothetical protein